LEQSAHRSSSKIALVDGEALLSYEQLLQLVDRLATQLQGQGISSGERIGLAFPNGHHYVALTYALWRCNVVVVPVPTECSKDEVQEIISGMDLQGILTAEPRKESIAVTPEIHFTRLQPVRQPDNHGLNLAFIRFTSGTTSARKGVALSHETILARINSANQVFRISDQDTIVWCLPMAHHFLITIVLYLEAGATVVLARHVTSKPFLEAINLWRGTILYAAPFHYAMLARDNSDVSITTVRLAVSTTCALVQQISADFLQRYGTPLVQGLGVIELGLVALNTSDPIKRWNSVGRAAGGFQIRLVDADAEGCGEVAVRGPGICDAYVSPWVEQERFLREGWFMTGDIGRMDSEGYLYLLTRKTAVINIAGRKVFPEELEAVLNRHPGVVESRVYGKPHPHLGEIIEAEIAVDDSFPGLDVIRAYCRDHLASFKIPSRIAVVPAIARTPVTGKVLRIKAAQSA